MVGGEATERSSLMFLIIRHKLMGKQYKGKDNFFHKIKAKAEKEVLWRTDRSLMSFDVVSEKPSRKKANNHLKRLDCVNKGNMLVSQRQTVDPENKIV